MTDAAANGPLAGLRILDLSVTLPGPFCTQALADLGAQVTKIEPPAGDMTRQSPTGIFHVANRNKQSVVLDLKTPEGVRACRGLAAQSDVAVEGFRPGVVDRLGVGYSELRRVKPDIVYCSISGYGQSGPLAMEPGHDVNYLAAGGALAYSGQWERSGPQRPALPVADLSAALYASVAILAALRRRDATGQGVHIDIALADCAMALASTRAGLNQQMRDDERRHLFPTNGLFACADGREIALGVVEDHFWTALRSVLDAREPQLAQARFATEALRRENGDALASVLRALFLTAPAQEWLMLLSGINVPVSMALTMPEAVQAPQVRARGLVQSLDGQRHVTFPALWDGWPVGRVHSNPPELGEHTAQVLGRLSCADAAITPS